MTAYLAVLISCRDGRPHLRPKCLERSISPPLDGPCGNLMLFLRAFQMEQQGGKTSMLGAFTGHAGSVQSIALNPRRSQVRALMRQALALTSSFQFCSGSWDGAVKIWVLPEEAGGAPVAQKKRKSAQPASAKVSVICVTAVWMSDISICRFQAIEAQSKLQGHTQCVTGVLWPTANQVISASWDQTLRLWDVESGACSATFAGSKPIQVCTHLS